MVFVVRYIEFFSFFKNCAEYKYKRNIVRLMQHLYTRTDHPSRRTTQASPLNRRIVLTDDPSTCPRLYTDELSAELFFSCPSSSVSGINRAN